MVEEASPALVPVLQVSEVVCFPSWLESCRTSLDEFPQFLQVITGELSLVGPRPHAVAHAEKYRALIHGYMLRQTVKPGITGWAQVNGWRGETAELEKMEERVRHDMEYIRNWNLLLELEVVFLTVFGAKKNRNAY